MTYIFGRIYASRARDDFIYGIVDLITGDN